MDYTVHAIPQARILEWVAFPFPRGSTQPRERTQISLIAGGFFTSWATREAQRLEIAVEFRLVSAHILPKMCISTEATQIYPQVCG